MKLTRRGFEQAREFIRTYARPLDLRLFEYYFEHGPAEAVLAALADYQNADGGFGHGIEPDFRLGASSPMATSVALQYAVAVNTGADHPLVVRALRYLVATYDQVDDYWPATYPNVNTEPHAPWWRVRELRPPEGSDWANPSAELLGYLYCYAQWVSNELLRTITYRARKVLACEETIGGLYRYNILCWQRAAPYLPTAFKNEVEHKIRATFARYPLTDENYAEVRVVWLAPSPDSILARFLPEVVARSLEREIARPGEDGGWWPGWQWGQYEDVWEIAKREWAGKITVETLHVLRNYGLIEGM
jgi:hypothetical protein